MTKETTHAMSVFWKDGRKEILVGPDAGRAFTRSGYKADDIIDVSFFSAPKELTTFKFLDGAWRPPPFEPSNTYETMRDALYPEDVPVGQFPKMELTEEKVTAAGQMSFHFKVPTNDKGMVQLGDGLVMKADTLKNAIDEHLEKGGMTTWDHDAVDAVRYRMMIDEPFIVRQFCQFCEEEVFTDDRHVGTVRNEKGYFKHYHLACLYERHPLPEDGITNYDALVVELFKKE